MRSSLPSQMAVDGVGDVVSSSFVSAVASSSPRPEPGRCSRGRRRVDAAAPGGAPRISLAMDRPVPLPPSTLPPVAVGLVST